MDRYIRLKEHGLNIDIQWEPSDEYLQVTDGSIAKRKYRIRTDADGFIRTGDNRPTGRSILFLGDSLIENTFVEEDRRICAVLETLLRQDGRDLRILNGGKSGATTLDLINLLLNKGVPLKPAAILLLSGAIDVAACERKGTYWNGSEHHSAVRHFNERVAAEPEDAEQLLDLQNRFRLLQILADVAGRFGIPLWICTMARRSKYDEWAAARYGSFELFRANADRIEAVNEVTRKFAEHERQHLIDLERLLDGRDEGLYDLLHPNEAGSRAIAEIICQRLSEFFAAELSDDISHLKRNADTSYQQEQFCRAEDALDEIVARQGADAQTHLCLSEAIVRQGRRDEAIWAARRAAELFPEDPDIQARLGFLLVEKGDFQQAETYFRRALSIAPSSGYIRRGLGHMLLRADRLAEAIEELQHTQALMPDDPVVKSWLERALDAHAKDARQGKRTGALGKARPAPNRAKSLNRERTASA
ncbi:MAG: tetratricopeptide repeat protein [Alphaproteobacteria bacterium]|nr:tetratricopeptide repeat protein [Alphaproteobacteria bacterium]